MVARSVLQALAALSVAIASGCGTPSTPAEEPSRTYLTHDELKALLSKTTSVRISLGRATLSGVYTPAGTATLDWGSGGAKGTWRIDANRFCTKYPGLRRGYESCYNFQKVAENTYNLFSTEDSSSSGTWLIEK